MDPLGVIALGGHRGCVPTCTTSQHLFLVHSHKQLLQGLLRSSTASVKPLPIGT